MKKCLLTNSRQYQNSDSEQKLSQTQPKFLFRKTRTSKNFRSIVPHLCRSEISNEGFSSPKVVRASYKIEIPEALTKGSTRSHRVFGTVRMNDRKIPVNLLLDRLITE